MIAITRAGSDLQVRPAEFLGDRFAAFREAIAAAAGRYDKDHKINIVPAAKLPVLYQALAARGFAVTMDDATRAMALETVAVQTEGREVVENAAATAEEALAARGLPLFEYQRAGVRWMAHRDRLVLGDQMGLGKSAQALIAARVRDPRLPLLIICPAAAKGVWAREQVPQWRPELHANVRAGRGSFRWPLPGEAVIANFDILPDDPGPAPHPVVLIVDEAHCGKNRTALRTERLRCISRSVRAAGGATWLLTGTPLLNHPEELWNVLELADLGGEAFANRTAYMQLCGAFLKEIYVRPFRGKDGKMHKTRKVWDYTGTVSPAAAEALRTVMLARSREEVLPDLPTKRKQMVSVETELDVEPFDGDLLEFMEALEEGRVQRGGIAFDEISRIRAELAAAKIPALLEHVAEYEETEEPLVVFSRHLAPVQALAGRDGWGIVTGDTQAEERTRIVAAFQAGQLRGIAGTIQAMGVAVTLTRAAHALFVDQDWTPALNGQAEDRICRIGQTRGVLIKVLVAEHPIDKRVSELLNHKSSLIEKIVGAATDTYQGIEIMELPEAPTIRIHCFHGEQPAPERPPKPPVQNRREARSEQEEWARRGLLTLTENDPDRARTVNSIGFNKIDNELGHSLAEQVHRGLSDKQWSLAIKILKKYHRQIGECPEATP